MEQRAKKKNMILISLIVLVSIIVAVAAFLIVSSRMMAKDYSEAIDSAEKYLAESNFDDAIVEYRRAIAIDPKNEDAYLGLAEIYIVQEDESNAKSILRKGYRETNSPKIDFMLKRLERYGIEGLVGKNSIVVSDLTTASTDITWNTSFLQKIYDFTYTDYQAEFGRTVSNTKDDDGYIEIKHNEFDGICFYRNTSSNKDIVDMSRRLPNAEGMPEKITLNSLNLLFRNFDGGVALERLQILTGEKLRPKKNEIRTYIEIHGDDCIIRIETDSDGNIISPNAWNEIILLSANDAKRKVGHLSGVVVDAVTGDGVTGAKLVFTPSGQGQSQTVTTDSGGVFSVDLEPGTYRIKITADNYIEEEFEFTVIEGRTYSGEQFIISPDLMAGTARIVLEWGAQPTDLDSYLSGETDTGVDVDTRFQHKQTISDGKVLAELDLDDIDGYGPETTTIYNLNGVYTFRVADYNRTGTMAQNGATVKVYLPGKDPVTITLNSGSGVNDVWTVCKIDHGELQVINGAPSEERFTPADK